MSIYFLSVTDILMSWPPAPVQSHHFCRVQSLFGPSGNNAHFFSVCWLINTSICNFIIFAWALLHMSSHGMLLLVVPSCALICFCWHQSIHCEAWPPIQMQILPLNPGCLFCLVAMKHLALLLYRCCLYVGSGNVLTTLHQCLCH